MQLNDAQVADEIHDINTETAWPLWPVLPMKHLYRKPGADNKLGILHTGNKSRVYLIHLYELESGPLKEQLEGVPFEDFESTEAMVREGWVGD